MNSAHEFFPTIMAPGGSNRLMRGRARVYLVGAGPGDPELLTLRAARLLSETDVIVYDHLVSPEVLALAACDAERVYAGKERNNHTMGQKEINELLVRLALQGKHVVRLKGGDPFIFGRGGEEMEALAERGVPFEVVPGITAACGVSCYAGIPLTHRDYAQSCLFVTGHLKDGTTNLDWTALARPRQTVVIYMGLGALAEICAKFIAHGVRPETPVAVVQQGTTQRQRVATGTLETMPAIAVHDGLKSPCLIIIGEVVKLQMKLAWFNPEPEEQYADSASEVMVNA
jgi:uroporphyrin-III C-methyltransferase/precorrin-2 dehydrogenase/sirohydrochlorin ferrochelatase